MKQYGIDLRGWLLGPAVFMWGTCLGQSADLISDRAAIERVYYAHRLGEKPPFERTLPQTQLEDMVLLDAKKEAVLRKVYAVEMTAEMVDSEVRRIEATTRAPDVLAEIKAALGNAPARFARAMARPIVVERMLRVRFENDDALHAPQSVIAGKIREAALAAAGDGFAKQVAVFRAGGAGAVTETTWRLAPRPEAGKAVESAPELPPTPVKATAKSGSYSVESTAQRAQSLGAPESRDDRKFYFEDLPPELQNVLRVHLQKPADVSAVIETSTAFLIFVVKEKTDANLSVASLAIPKRSYEEWLASQPQP